MVEIGLAEAEQDIHTLLARVIQGEQVAIMKAGCTVARIVPGDGRTSEQRKEAEEAVKRIEARSASLSGDFRWETLKQDRDFGRR